ncbi:hypothetical protein DM01DRAFT_1405027 [Hesseltinella vesiculosa]|uniref:Uncharacterized protein n=1 Tax=Hesseltinella vesiculosa TaxID=101127 RepID=A0A1X2GQS8_9FUNG|nr:hypothetical protein DM01DRAFT_1405027 [Hesseltinella vesiculosa]
MPTARPSPIAGDTEDQPIHAGNQKPYESRLCTESNTPRAPHRKHHDTKTRHRNTESNTPKTSRHQVNTPQHREQYTENIMTPRRDTATSRQYTATPEVTS